MAWSPGVGVGGAAVMTSTPPPSPPGTPRRQAFETVTGLGYPAGFAEERPGLTGTEEEEDEFDDEVGPLEAIALRARGGTRKQKERFLRGLSAAVAGTSGADCRAVLGPLMLDVAMDDDADLRQIAAEQIGFTGPLCAEKWGATDEGAGQQLLEFVDILTQLLEDEFEEVQMAAEQALGALVPLLSRAEAEARVLSRLERLIESEEEEVRLSAARVLAQVGVGVEEGMCQYLVLPMLAELSEDAGFRVRKAAAVSTLKLLGSTRADMIEETVLPVFKRLAEDDAWSVRATCVEALPVLLGRLEVGRHHRVFRERFLLLAADDNLMVQRAARKSSGRFIVALGAEHSDGMMVAIFVQAAAGQSAGESEALECAYTLPGVALTLNQARWPEIRPAFDALLHSQNVKVRRKVAQGLHELARAVGPEYCQIDIVPGAEFILRDVDDVQRGLLASLVSLLRALPGSERSFVLDYLPLLAASESGLCGSWRARFQLAGQLAEISELCSALDVAEVLLPALLDLCRDPVAAVRKVAAAQVGPVLAEVVGFRGSSVSVSAVSGQGSGSSGSDAAAEASKALRDFAFGSYRSKQTFAEICARMSDCVPRELFVFEFAPMLLALAEDEVPNVRASVARLLNSYRESLSGLPGAAHALVELGKDPDYDVAFAARFGAPDFVTTASEGGDWERGGGGERPGGGTPGPSHLTEKNINLR